MSVWVKRVVCAAVVVLFGFALGRAASFRFREKEDAIRNAFLAELRTLGGAAATIRARYFTPEIHMVSGGCLPAGGTGEVVVQGKFAPGTRFVFENDNLEVVKENLAGNMYRATLKVAPGIGPETAALTAISPVTAVSTRHDDAVTIGGRYEWLMETGNGWKIVARSTDNGACGDRRSGGSPYHVLFYRRGEAQPFEKMEGRLRYSMYERTSFQFALNEVSAAGNAMQDRFALMQKLSDRNLSEAEREKIMQQLEKSQAEMMAQMKKMTDPAYMKQLQAKRLEFGCERIALESQGGSFKGDMRCSDKVGNRVPVTGTMKPL